MVNALEETRELLENHHDFVSKNPHHDFVCNNSHHDVTMSTEARCSRYPRLPDPRDPRNPMLDSRATKAEILLEAARRRCNPLRNRKFLSANCNWEKSSIRVELFNSCSQNGARRRAARDMRRPAIFLKPWRFSPLPLWPWSSRPWSC